MKNKHILLIIVILAITLGIFHYYIKEKPGKKEIQQLKSFIGGYSQWQDKFAPDFEIQLLNGEKFTLSDNIGKKIIILNFFTTWCVECESEMAELEHFYQKHRDDRFILLGINIDEKAEKVREFIAEHKISFPIGIDRDEIVTHAYQVAGTPTTAFIGADGKIAIYEIGGVHNADAIFGSLYETHIDILDANGGISKDTYLEMLKYQKQNNESVQDEDEFVLEGRAKNIAQKMDCPCGCDEKVIECSCSTAKNIKEKLKEITFNGKTDEEVIKQVNKEFCVGAQNKR